MITAIELCNFKTHERTQVEFASGTNVIVGVMGSGKSSVMEALCFGLFGTFPSLKSHKVTLLEIVRGFGSEDKAAFASVRVDFSFDGESYSVSRKISEGESEAFLRKNGSLLEGPQPARVTECVESLLGMDYDAFVRTAYCEQNKIDHFLALGKGDRKKQLDGLLGLDRLEKARQSLSTVHNNLAVEANAHKKDSKTPAQIQEMEKQLNDAADSALLLEKNAATIAQTVIACANGLEKAQTELDYAKKMQEKSKAIDMEMQRISATVAALRIEAAQREKRIDQLSLEGATENQAGLEADLAASALEMQRLEVRLVEAATTQAKALSATQKAQRLSVELSLAKATLFQILESAKSKDAAEFAVALGQAADKKDLLQKNLFRCRALLDAARKSANGLALADAECPVCAKPLEQKEKEGLFGKRQEEVRHYEQEERQTAGELTLAERTEKALRNLVDNARILEAKIESAAKDYAEAVESASGKELAEAKAAEAKAALFAERQKNASITKKASLASARLAEVKALAAVLSRAANLEKKKEFYLEELETQKKAKEYIDDAGFAALEAIRTDAMRKAYDAKAELERANAEMTAKRKDAEIAKAAVADAKKKADLAISLEQRAHKARSLQNALVDVQEGLRQRLIGAVNDALSFSWKKLYPYADYSFARLSPLSDDYALELCTAGGEWIAVERVSGGERSTASLALRMAFARVLAPTLDMLILDEPTHNLDSAGVAALCDALRAGAAEKARFRQVFVITHDESMREAADGSLYEFSRSKAGADPTVAVLVSEQA
ncbi:MAG: SMC family ATPase [Candidatus Micrarchaeia archaeon]|jgi:exonuclease SbcC